MKKSFAAAWLCLLCTTCAQGASYLEGKPVLDKTYKVDIVRMDWGSKDKDTDRILGTVHLYVSNPSEALQPITLTFDVYGKKMATNAAPAKTVAGQPTGETGVLKAEKLGTVEFTFDFQRYGYKFMRTYVEGDFCADFAGKPDACRLFLVNVKVSGQPVTYQTSFNVSASLLKTAFTLAEPKVTAQKVGPAGSTPAPAPAGGTRTIRHM
jgi:hypothetical protein